MKIDKFWMVVGLTDVNEKYDVVKPEDAPKIKHAKFEIASQEAERLAIKCPEKTFVVLEAIQAKRTEKPKVETATILGDFTMNAKEHFKNVPYTAEEILARDQYRFLSLENLENEKLYCQSRIFELSEKGDIRKMNTRVRVLNELIEVKKERAEGV